MDVTQTQQRNQMVIVAIWLISLGAVFLIRELANWSWAEAWPLWIIFIGVGSVGSTLFSRQPAGSLIWSITWPLAAIAVGAVLLMSTTGAIALAPEQLIAWWPLAIIAIGLWFLVGAVVVRQPRAALDELTIPLAGASVAEVRIRFGAGELTVGPAAAGMLVAGRFEGGVVHRTGRHGMVELEQPSPWPFGWRGPARWDVGLATEIPLDLRLDAGASKSEIDLSELRVLSLEVRTGASETRIALPRSGQTLVRAEAGAASLVIAVPEGVAARIHSRMALGQTHIDERRFPRSGDGWTSPDYDSAANRADINIEGGLGSVRIV